MRVGQNSDFQALNMSRLQARHTNNANSNVAKLASGSRINTGADDPAGITMAAQLKGRAVGYDAAAQNAQNAATVVKSADSAYSNALDVLYRMRELATQAQDDSLTDNAKANIDEEGTLLTNRLADIIASTKWGGGDDARPLVDGSGSFSFLLGVESTTGSYDVDFDELEDPGFSSLSTPDDIDSAIDTLAQAQGKAGAFANAIGYVADGVSMDASTAWEAFKSFTATDTSKEMTNYVNNTILTQQAQLINAQYNQNAYSVLNLLK